MICSFSCVEHGAGREEIHRIRDLSIGCLAGHDDNGTTGSLDQRGIVRGLGRSMVGRTELSGGEALRRLDCQQLVPVDHTAGAPPDRVGHGHPGDDGVGAGPNRIDHRTEQRCGRQRTSGIVHQNHTAVVVDDGESGPNRLRPARTTGNDVHDGARGCDDLGRLDRIGRHDDDDTGRTCSGGIHGSLQNGDSSKICELFAHSESQARATCHNDGPDGIHADCRRTCRMVAHVTIIAYVMVDSSLLSSVDLFRDVDPEYIAELSAAATERSLWRGDVLFAEGQEPDALYIVTSGRIAIANKSIDGRESVVALMEEGDLFGEMGLFDGLGRSAEARALEPSKVAEIPYDPVRRTYEAHPELLWRVVDMLARRLRSMDEALADSVFLDVTGRTAKRLLELAGDADEFTLPITQEELSGMVGASRERVNKAISAFIRLGWLSQTDRRYTITNRKQLEIRSR